MNWLKVSSSEYQEPLLIDPLPNDRILRFLSCKGLRSRAHP
jgi:hypothetical protein